MRVFYRFLAAALLVTGLMATQASADDKYQHYTGCVSGTHDNYFLRTDTGITYRLHSDKDINEHVGRRVDVRGRVDNKKRDERAQSAAAASGVLTEAAGINVEDIKTIGGTCSNVSAMGAAETGVSSAVASGIAGGAATGVASDASGKYEHFTGCLSGTHDNYFLRADDGNTYRLHSDKDINEHVGRRVDVRGRVENKKRDQDAQAAAAATGTRVEEAGINVEDIKSISGSCSAMPPSGSAAVVPDTGASPSIAAGTAGGTSTSGIAADDSAKYDRFAGCLTGTNGNYFLRADNGNLYRLHSDKDINEHVGNRVEVRGRVDNQQKDRDAQAVASATGSETEAAGINVEDIKTVARGCMNP